MADTYLYLFGGNPEQKEASIDFFQKSGGKQAKIALLQVYRAGWEDYLHRYIGHWVANGLDENNVSVIVPNKDGYIDEQSALTVLEEATGIYIGGGHTETYHSLYTSPSFKSIIAKKFYEGVPVAGNSAGALIAPETVLLSPHDTDSGKAIITEGIGLTKDILISVHYTYWNDAIHLQRGLNHLDFSMGYGIDDDACLVLKNDQYHCKYGSSHVYEVKKI
ncbi:Type 1 glutamine amidotransferase-like domain-containing protein [Aquibacillus kalidii]|uniref:Type 1 glutamine amidotransferase-like domain-containing protein n=1 Tax=Aquibacillus kalidii TaxID=2762597 RepID=UPI001648EE97|nr:Type 1 glutamine amidotransferase-like domain-containing protein [Aquibacillus kalidii]